MRRFMLAVGVVAAAIGMARAQEGGAAAEAVEAAAVQVEQIAVGTAVENRELTGQTTTFAPGTTQVACWTKVTTPQPPAQLRHVYYADGKEVASVPLTVNYPAARTWSRKNVWPGQWKVVVLGQGEAELAQVEFLVQ